MDDVLVLDDVLDNVLGERGRSDVMVGKWDDGLEIESWIGKVEGIGDILNPEFNATVVEMGNFNRSWCFNESVAWSNNDNNSWSIVY